MSELPRTTPPSRPSTRRRRAAARAAALLLSLLAASACASARGGGAGEAAASAEGLAVDASHPALNATLWMQQSAEYEALTRQTYRLARRSLDRALADSGWSALARRPDASGGADGGDGGEDDGRPPAVIVDVDETVLSNAPFQARLARTGRDFRPDLWHAWVREEKARPVPGALAFLREADRRGVDVYYVTNRDHAVEPATRANLEALGFPLDAPGDAVLTQGEREGWGSDKADRRAAVAEHHRVLLLVGDALHDFVAAGEVSLAERRRIAERHADRWGRSWIVLPNPAYGGWEQAAYGYRSGLTPAEIRARKLESLDPARGDGGGSGGGGRR